MDLRIRKKIVRLSIFCNLSLFIIIGVLLLYPAASSWIRNRTDIRHLQSEYDSYSRLVQDYSNIEALDIYGQSSILPYDDLATALEDVLHLALAYGFETPHVEITQPTALNIAEDGSIFVEVRMSATFIGERNIGFFHSLANSSAYIRMLRISFLEEGDNIRIELSLFGRR